MNVPAGLNAGLARRAATLANAETENFCQVAPPAASPGAETVVPKYAWYVIGLLTLVNVVNYMDRMALAILSPSIKVDLGLTDSQLGLLVGVSFSLFYAFCGIPIARWADKGTRRSIIALALATWSVMTALSGAAQNFWHLFLARVGIGAGEAGCLPPAASLICDYVPVRRRSGIFALHTFGLIAGMMVGMALAGWLSGLIGWRWTFVALGLPGVALAIIVRLTMREPVRGFYDSAKSDAAAPPFGTTVKILWACRTYRLITLLCVVNGFMQYALNQWWPSFYTRAFGLELSSVGVYLGVALGGGAGMGLLLGGFVANRAAQRDVTYPLLLGAVTMCLAFPVVLASLFVSSAKLSIALVALAALLWNVSNGPLAAAALSVVASGVRATANSITVFSTSVLGFGLGPFCVGVLSDLLTPSLGLEALRYALVLPILLHPVMAYVLYATAKVMLADLKAAGVQL